MVREFKATPRNVAILLIDRPDIDIAAHEKAVKQSLALLAAQSYLPRPAKMFLSFSLSTPSTNLQKIAR